MKILRIKPELCTACYACEEVCSTNVAKEKNREKTAIKINKKISKKNYVEMISCDQCGDCIDICPVEAIYRSKSGIVLIKKSECVGCYSCVGFCPSDAMMYHHELAEPFKCTSCGKCVKECPTEALYLEEVTK